MEARINTKNILIVLSPSDESLLKDFCGIVLTANDHSSGLPSFARKTVYLCGDLCKANDYDLKAAARIFVIKELSHGYDDHGDSKAWTLIDLGRVPILVHGVGVLYRRFFDLDSDYFQRIHTEHALQSLTESTKPGIALRTGIYLTPVKQDGAELHFRLLRCSTNLSGPTENFRANDRHIVDALNQEATYIFRNQAPLNHVLAQNYSNRPATATQKQVKAKISAHADKTKDMPVNGIMAFCTFYDQLDQLRPLPQDAFDFGYKGISGLTKLHFRAKESSEGFHQSSLPSQFVVTLYPNSVFFMPLSTNRLYTHEIQSSALDAGLLPTRLGYVVRCSKAEAVHDSGDTFLKIGRRRMKLEPPTIEGMNELRKLYVEENKSQARMNYGNQFFFSMNAGDYMAPEYKMADEFRTYTLPVKDKIFAELLASVQFEALGKGRQGAVLVKTDETNRIPIVRTTTKYTAPAQHFQSIHEQLAQQIRKFASLSTGFNNALIEIYTNAYTTMGSHSDQALDLADESFIAVFSCYEHPELATSPRMLVVESKESGGEFQIAMTHNSVIVFSTDTNRRFKHKIVLDTSAHT
ncbi:hypothetical protein H2198_003977 [Neophaeococcomyces mojaviensis]|uniref:Uncharacterized protein n=1 Tax=Neophaeococcomyces mojaviensis TaxID=3383035 RepID=A0ACC3A9Y3_9EURO|nr:hypothetical protein H2198_003977 [Knufia sp. JES_112]